MKRARHFCWLLALCAGLAQVQVQAQSAERLPAYQRVDKLQGAVQLSGSSAVATFARAWGAAFQQMNPGAPVTVVAKSSGAAIGDMLANPATIGMTSRPLNAAERESYARQHGQPPLEFKVAIDAVAIYVFKDNPLQSISMSQLERIFAAAPRSGAAVAYWGEMGLAGEWAQRAVRHNANYLVGWRELAASAILLGRDSESRQAVERVLALEPGYSISTLRTRYPLSAPEKFEVLFDALRRAGVPE